MKNRILLTLAFITTFFVGFAFRSMTAEKSSAAPTKKVTGIGGIFFKCNDPKK
jgi:hypothetical protein